MGFLWTSSRDMIIDADAVVKIWEADGSLPIKTKIWWCEYRSSMETDRVWKRNKKDLWVIGFCIWFSVVSTYWRLISPWSKWLKRIFHTKITGLSSLTHTYDFLYLILKKSTSEEYPDNFFLNYESELQHWTIKIQKSIMLSINVKCCPNVDTFLKLHINCESGKKLIKTVVIYCTACLWSWINHSFPKLTNDYVTRF